ncbi:MAG: hypothetical protein ACRDV9_00665 [Acidimicrobiia bacterium]
MADLEFFWDPVCPWAWITSRWIVEVSAQQPMTVDWKFIALRIVNEKRNYEAEFPPGYERTHQRGMNLLRVAAAVRQEVGPQAVLPLYSAYGATIHDQGNPTSLDDPQTLRKLLGELGLPEDLADATQITDHDEAIRSETGEALERCGGFIGTPVLTFSPPEGPSLFGPVIARVPKGEEALQLWEAVGLLGRTPYFSELKRSNRGKPNFNR